MDKLLVATSLDTLRSIHSFSSLSYDRSKASSKASSPHGAIQSFLLQMRVSYILFHSFSSLSYDRSKASSKASSPHGAIQSFLLQMRVSYILFIHLVVCLTTGPKPLPKRALHVVRSRASSFKCEYLTFYSFI